jgi:hypothetical protein
MWQATWNILKMDVWLQIQRERGASSSQNTNFLVVTPFLLRTHAPENHRPNGAALAQNLI